MIYPKEHELELRWSIEWLEKQLLKGTLPVVAATDSIHSIRRAADSAELSINLGKVEDFFNRYVQSGLANKKLQQALRARRKRMWNRACTTTQQSKRSIDIDATVHQMLSDKSSSMGMTLSETIEYLIQETEEQKAYLAELDIKKIEETA